MQGIVQAVNKNGIKLNDKWYNATKECEAYVTPDLKGCSVEITLLPESSMFTFLKKLGESKEYLGKGAVSETDMRYRAMSIAYAKDLVVSEDITCTEMLEVADGIFFYIKTGAKTK